MRAWAKKKNNDFAVEAEYLLPELPQNITPAGAVNVAVPPKPVAEPAAEVKEVAEVVEPAMKPLKEPETKLAIETEKALVSEVQPAERAKEVSEVASSAVDGGDAGQTTARRKMSGGLSILDMMNTDTMSEEPAEKVEEKVVSEIDPASEEKITLVKEQIIHTISEERPRFVVAFEKMSVSGNTIEVEVPTQALYEEIMRAKLELLMQVASIAGVQGRLELSVKINEQMRASVPIKLEDRVKYMTDKNPNLLKLKQMLDMEFE